MWGVAAGEGAVMGAERLVRVDHTPKKKDGRAHRLVVNTASMSGDLDKARGGSRRGERWALFPERLGTKRGCLAGVSKYGRPVGSSRNSCRVRRGSRDWTGMLNVALTVLTRTQIGP